MPASASSSRSTIRDTAIGLAVTALLLMVGEAVARVAETVERDWTTPRVVREEPVFAGSPELGWIRRPGFSGVAEGDALREFDAEGYYTLDSDQVRDVSTPKVVFIGDSNTFGYGVASDASFAEVVDRLLPGAHAINLGVPGYSSYQGVIVARKYLPLLKPRIAVVSFNFNDRRFMVPPFPDDAQQMDRVYRRSGEAPGHRLAEALEYSSMFRGLRRVFTAIGLTPGQPSESIDVNLETVVPRVGEAAYRENLTAIVALCRELGVTPVFVLLRDAPAPTRSLRAGVASLQNGDAMVAVSALTRVLEEGAPETLALRDVARLYLAQAYRALDQPARANASINVAAPRSDLDGWNPVRLDTVYNQIMREVAERLDVAVIDGSSVLEEHPGCFIDICHFNAEGHALLGRLIAERLSPLLGAQPAPAANETAQ